VCHGLNRPLPQVQVDLALAHKVEQLPPVHFPGVFNRVFEFV
jgi:hypothetical protein